MSVPAVSKASVSAASKAYRLKAIANRFVASGTKATLKLKVPKAALRAIKRALRGGKKVKASIKLTARDGAVQLEVTDDGVGMAGSVRRSGLANMLSRAQELGGALEVDTAPGAGTRVRWRVPLPR